MASPPPDNEYTLALAAGRSEAHAALYERLSGRMLRIAYAILRNADEAEDALHDLFVSFAHNRQRFLHVEDIDAYVFACFRHALLARLKRQGNEQGHLRRLARTISTSETTSGSSCDDELGRGLESLPTDQREVVLLKVDGGLTFMQIAQILRISPNTAASRYRYALDKLRRWLEDRA